MLDGIILQVLSSESDTQNQGLVMEVEGEGAGTGPTRFMTWEGGGHTACSFITPCN